MMKSDCLACINEVEDHTHVCGCGTLILDDSGNMNEEAWSEYCCNECAKDLGYGDE